MAPHSSDPIFGVERVENTRSGCSVATLSSAALTRLRNIAIPQNGDNVDCVDRISEEVFPEKPRRGMESWCARTPKCNMVRIITRVI